MPGRTSLRGRISVDVGACARAVKNGGAMEGTAAKARADRTRKREILRVMDRLGRAGSMNCQSYAARYGEAIEPKGGKGGSQRRTERLGVLEPGEPTKPR